MGNGNGAPKHLQTLFVAVDACAEMGGQPYAVLAALKNVYDVTGRRKLMLVDTQQGFQEKTNCAAPGFLATLPNRCSPCAGFLREHPDWTEVIPTQSCTGFRRRLAADIVPRGVLPLVALSEEMAAALRRETYRLMKERGLAELDGKPVTCPSDVEIRVRMREKTAGFGNELVDYAAEKLLPAWKDGVNRIEALNPQNSKKYGKAFMAEIIRASQEMKAYAWGLTREHAPHNLRLMQGAPRLEEELPAARMHEVCHRFDRMRLPHDAAWWESSEAVQALRLTHLWPWAQKKNFSAAMKDRIDACHADMADNSYLSLFANTLPQRCDPAATLFIILTHDRPLASRFLELASGVSHAHQGGKNGETAVDTYTASNIHADLGLAHRPPEQYPHHAALVAPEFITFAYKEVLYALEGSGHIREPAERSRLWHAVTESSQEYPTAYPELKKAVAAASLPEGLRHALGGVLEETRRLEETARESGHACCPREGRYSQRLEKQLRKREELQIR